MTDANTANRPLPAGVGPVAQDHAGGRSSAARPPAKAPPALPREALAAEQASARRGRLVVNLLVGFGPLPRLRFGRAQTAGYEPSVRPCAGRFAAAQSTQGRG